MARIGRREVLKDLASSAALAYLGAPAFAQEGLNSRIGPKLNVSTEFLDTLDKRCLYFPEAIDFQNHPVSKTTRPNGAVVYSVGGQVNGRTAYISQPAEQAYSQSTGKYSRPTGASMQGPLILTVASDSEIISYIDQDLIGEPFKFIRHGRSANAGDQGEKEPNLEVNELKDLPLEEQLKHKEVFSTSVSNLTQITQKYGKPKSNRTLRNG